MSDLQPVADGIWSVTSPQNFLGFRVGTRMTLVRLKDGDLWLHSPVPITGALRGSVDLLGPVRHIVCPNLYHHLYAGQAKATWPQALLHGPGALARKRPDLHFDAELSDTPHPDWRDDLQSITIKGCTLDETLFFHGATGTLITADLVENFHHVDHLPTRWWLKVGGIYGRVGWHRLLRMVYRDHVAARASLERILALPIQRVIVAHGNGIITRDPTRVVRDALAWV